jgi:hypothetical protein
VTLGNSFTPGTVTRIVNNSGKRSWTTV